MKYIFFILSVCFLFNSAWAQSEFDYNNLKVIPAKPRPGDNLHFIYHAEKTVLAGEDSIRVRILYANVTSDGKGGMAAMLRLKKTAMGYEGNFTGTKNMKAVAMAFDNNLSQGSGAVKEHENSVRGVRRTLGEV